MKPKKQASDAETLKRTLHTLYVAAYMLQRRIEKQNADIRKYIDKLREAGVKDDELISIKLEAFYTANPEERLSQN